MKVNFNFQFKKPAIERLKRTQINLLREPLRLAQCLSWRYSFLLSPQYLCRCCAGSLYRPIVLGPFLSAFAVPLCVAQSVPRLYLLAYGQISEIQSKNTQSTNSICAIITPITNLSHKKCKLADEYKNYLGRG